MEEIKNQNLPVYCFHELKDLENMISVFYFADFYIPTRAIGNSRSFWSLYINLLMVHTEGFSLKKVKALYINTLKVDLGSV